VNTHVWWYVARAGGLVGWALVTAAVIWGLALSTRITRRPRPAWVLDLHRFLGTLSVVFVGVHVLALVADSYTHFGPASILVPFASTWHPLAVAWGVVGLYLLVAIQVTSWLMRWISRRVWRAVHFSAFALFVVSTIHGLAAGTDAGNVVVRWFALTSCALVGFLTLVRITTTRGPKRPDAPRAPTGPPPRAHHRVGASPAAGRDL
jgi:predicted ferric reductase